MFNDSMDTPFHPHLFTNAPKFSLIFLKVALSSSTSSSGIKRAARLYASFAICSGVVLLVRF